jgi:hypothetical protein
MPLQVSTEFKRRILGPESFGTIFNGGAIAIYGSAAQPDYADSAVAGTLLGYVTHNGATWTPGAALNGLQYVQAGAFWLKSPAQIWQITPVASGLARWFRVLPVAPDAGGISTSHPRIDGTITADGAGAQMRLLNPNLVLGEAVEISDFWYSLLPLSGI